MSNQFKTLLLSKIYDPEPSVKEMAEYHMIGVVCDKRVHIIKNRYDANDIEVDMDTWFKLVRDSTERWNISCKKIELPRTKLRMFFTKYKGAIINYVGYEDETTSNPQVSISHTDICSLCNKTGHILEIEPSGGEYDGVNICFTCLRNIMANYEENV